MQYPGTVINASDNDIVSFFNGLFAKKELSQVQLMGLTGLSQSTLQNWVNRGFIKKSQRKGYDKDGVARILIVNMLRKALSLDDVSRLLYYINGELDDTSDDIISESLLYIMVCQIVFDQNYSEDNLANLIEKVIAGQPQKNHQRLSTGISIIVRAYTLAKALDGINQSMKTVISDTNDKFSS